MSVLKQKLDKAAEQFQLHNFKQSLTLYEDCLAFCNRTRQSSSVIHNILTTKAALLSILGDLDQAMSTLKQVLSADSSHYLALIRRSQLFKKRGKLNRALKDLEMVATFCPDNLQIAAMRIEIQNLKNKSKAPDSSEQSESEDEEVQLNFANLKKIDRKSSAAPVEEFKDTKDTKGRKSRVTIMGDTAVVYQREDEADKTPKAPKASKEQMKERFVRASLEIEMEKDVAAPPTNIVAKNNNRCKSILKNKLNFQQPTLIQPKEVPIIRESKLIDKLKNIDGKVIGSSHSIQGNESGKQVEFRKSLFAPQQKQVAATTAVQKAGNRQSRKSCLKTPSFDSMQMKQNEAPAVRRSKFETLSRKSIDGVVLKKRRSIEVKDFEGDIPKIQEEDSDEGSSYNIFGSNANVMLSKEMKEKLGISEDEGKEKKTPKPRTTGGKSILKKNSVLFQGTTTERPERGESSEVQNGEQVVAKKPKKSVMFTKSRFAE